MKKLLIFLLFPAMLNAAGTSISGVSIYGGAAAVGDAVHFRIYTGGVTATVDQILVDGASFTEVCE